MARRLRGQECALLMRGKKWFSEQMRRKVANPFPKQATRRAWAEWDRSATRPLRLWVGPLGGPEPSAATSLPNSLLSEPRNWQVQCTGLRKLAHDAGTHHCLNLTSGALCLAVDCAHALAAATQRYTRACCLCLYSMMCTIAVHIKATPHALHHHPCTVSSDGDQACFQACFKMHRRCRTWGAEWKCVATGHDGGQGTGSQCNYIWDYPDKHAYQRLGVQ
jgi:hypothetical protein